MGNSEFLWDSFGVPFGVPLGFLWAFGAPLGPPNSRALSARAVFSNSSCWSSMRGSRLPIFPYVRGSWPLSKVQSTRVSAKISALNSRKPPAFGREAAPAPGSADAGRCLGAADAGRSPGAAANALLSKREADGAAGPIVALQAPAASARGKKREAPR